MQGQPGNAVAFYSSGVEGARLVAAVWGGGRGLEAKTRRDWFTRCGSAGSVARKAAANARSKSRGNVKPKKRSDQEERKSMYKSGGFWSGARFVEEGE
ncbi:hypothetical protein E4U09_003093 [Claviceps aff. purpurea]|uniref:Uncharacterized protein n=1 Tax=Claviceps aff. purpurea TaxID=1967640 RepID=A0A9P7U2B8_9HYPO|nr:hypothetical protein E4U09_003093 [Claviceps aff. purpurea]